jgi:hypothetical protein
MSGFRDFKAVANSNTDTAKLQARLVEFFTPIQNCDLIDGVRLVSITLTAGSENAIDHKLGRELLGWIMVRNRANATVWDTQDANKFKDKTLSLNTSADTVVDLWVF